MPKIFCLHINILYTITQQHNIMFIFYLLDMRNMFLHCFAFVFSYIKVSLEFQYLAQGHFSIADMLTHWFNPWFFIWMTVAHSVVGIWHTVMHLCILPTGFSFVRLSGGLEPIPTFRVQNAEILSQGVHRGIQSLIPHTCRQSGVSSPHDLLYISFGCGRKLEHPYQTNAECGGEGNSK